MTSMPSGGQGSVGGAPGGRPGGAAAPASAAGSIDPVKLLLRYKWLLLASFFVGITFGVGLNVVLGRIAPRYISTIQFEVTAQEEATEILRPAVSEDELVRVMNTQVNTIMSRGLLERVATDPRLESEAPEWARQFREGGTFDYIQARLELEQIVTASVVPGTSIVLVRVTGNNADTPFAIAKVLQDTYMSQVSQQSTSDIRKRTDQLRARLDLLDDTLEELRGRKQRLIRDQSLETIDQRTNQSIIQLNNVNNQLNEIRNNTIAAQTSLDRMTAMLDPAATIQYSDTQRQQVEQLPAVLQQKAAINALRTRLQSLREQGIKPQHREYKRLVADIRAGEAEKNAIVQRELRSLFDAQLDQTRLLVGQLRNQELALVERSKELEGEATDFQELLVQVQEIDGQIFRYEEERNVKQSDLERLEDLVLVGAASRVDVFQAATKPDERAFPKLIPMVAIGVFLICGLTGLSIIAREMLDQRIKGPSDVAMIPRTRVFGIVPISTEDPDAPKRVETIFRDASQGVMAESFRQLRTTLIKRASRGGHKSVMIVPGMPGSGATTIAVNLAFACAAADRRVLIVDANYRRPSVHKVFGREAGPGLADVLSGARSLSDAVVSTDTESVDVLTAGSKDKRVFEHLGAEGMARLLNEAGAKYDLILVDTAPAVVAGDSSALATLCDASILVVRAMVEKRGMVARVKNELSESHAEFLGVIVNAVRAAAGGYMRGNIRASFEYQKDGPKGADGDKGKKSSDEPKAA